ncbi:alpha/beta hydrolase [Telluribacter sp.]|jgi:pimeloyl-ACP methyl ester carboxylesterase|uniref:alpha/beta fold hydrolase n=1 Tax=Telluribacter sp. TaxID=1978767 RepID=UPI002E15D139|nr:alpha/beta hydrolase [Telluribacter sp.]
MMKTIKFTIALLLMAALTFAQPKAIRVLKSGQGTAVLFLPGFTSPGSVWNETISHLSKVESHVVSYAGFNGIPPVETPWYPRLRQELLAYIEQEKLGNLTLIGHSMGGNLAVDIAAALPDRVTKLVLVDAIPCMRALMMPGVPASQISYESPYNKQILEMPNEQFAQMAAGMAGNMTNNKAMADTLARWTVEAHRPTYVYGYTDLLKLDLREVLPSIKAETLILGAPFPDEKIVLENFQKQYALLPAKTIQIAPASRHFIMFDQPDWLYEKVADFLKNE